MFFFFGYNSPTFVLGVHSVVYKTEEKHKNLKEVNAQSLPFKHPHTLRRMSFAFRGLFLNVCVFLGNEWARLLMMTHEQREVVAPPHQFIEVSTHLLVEKYTAGISVQL